MDTNSENYLSWALDQGPNEELKGVLEGTIWPRYNEQNLVDETDLQFSGIENDSFTFSPPYVYRTMEKNFPTPTHRSCLSRLIEHMERHLEATTRPRYNKQNLTSYRRMESDFSAPTLESDTRWPFGLWPSLTKASQFYEYKFHNTDETLSTMNNLASTYTNQGRVAEAEKPQKDALKSHERVLGKDHPDTLLVVNSLANTYTNQGWWAEAEKLQKDALKSHERVLGKDHPDTLFAMNNLAIIYMEQGRWTVSEKLQVEALERHRGAFERAVENGCPQIVRLPGEGAGARNSEATFNIHYPFNITKAYRRLLCTITSILSIISATLIYLSLRAQKSLLVPSQSEASAPEIGLNENSSSPNLFRIPSTLGGLQLAKPPIDLRLLFLAYVVYGFTTPILYSANQNDKWQNYFILAGALLAICIEFIPICWEHGNTRLTLVLRSAPLFISIAMAFSGLCHVLLRRLAKRQTLHQVAVEWGGNQNSYAITAAATFSS